MVPHPPGAGIPGATPALGALASRSAAWAAFPRSAAAAPAAYNPSIGADVVVEVKLSREQARDGARVAVKYPRYESCDNCHVSGLVASEHHRACPTCGGTGSIAVDLGMFGMGQARMVCPECGGSGKVVADPCPVCGGEGRTRVQGEAVVEFPAGTHDGDLVRMKGRGNAGTNGGETGDLVGRAHVSAERLEGRARSGFYTLGFGNALPGALLVFGHVLHVLAAVRDPACHGPGHGPLRRRVPSQRPVVEARPAGVCQRRFERSALRPDLRVVLQLAPQAMFLGPYRYM